MVIFLLSGNVSFLAGKKKAPDYRKILHTFRDFPYKGRRHFCEMGEIFPHDIYEGGGLEGKKRRGYPCMTS